MASTLKLEIVTPVGTVFSDDVEMVTLPSVEGQIGVYPRHVPLITYMVPGEMIVRKDGQDDNDMSDYHEHALSLISSSPHE